MFVAIMYLWYLASWLKEKTVKLAEGRALQQKKYSCHSDILQERSVKADCIVRKANHAQQPLSSAKKNEKITAGFLQQNEDSSHPDTLQQVPANVGGYLVSCPNHGEQLSSSGRQNDCSLGVLCGQCQDGEDHMRQNLPAETRHPFSASMNELLNLSAMTFSDQCQAIEEMTEEDSLHFGQSHLNFRNQYQTVQVKEASRASGYLASVNMTEQCEGIEIKKEADHDSEEEREEGGPVFNPPVCVQRYALVQKVLQEHGVESVVDFGSAQCRIFNWLKEVNTLTHIFLVDVDETVLNTNKNKIKPVVFDYVFPRSVPLTVSVLHGSAGDLDSRVLRCQAASLVEIIEHLEPSMLEQVKHCVFGRLRPSLVVVTTPNADFNILFPHFSGFRHWDHKFEWTRAEFQEWCESVCTYYGYSVSYTGVGDPTPQMSHVGFCSQAAIFLEISGKSGEQTDNEVYKLIHKVVYPFDARTPSQRLADEADYAVNNNTNQEEYRCHDNDSLAVIPVSVITSCVLSRRKTDQWEQADVITYLQSKYTFTEDGSSIVLPLDDVDSSSCDSRSDEEPDVDGQYHACGETVLSEEEWE